MNENAFIQYLIQQLLSYIPGAGPLLSSFISPGAANWLSDPSSISNKFVWPGQNGSLRTSLFNYMDTIRNAGYSRASNVMSNQAELMALIEYKRMLNPSATEEQLRVMAQQEADNPFSGGSLMYRAMDPYGMRTALPAAQTLASTLHKRGSDFTLQGATYARAVQDAIFHKDSGILREIVQDPGAYGNLSATDVMQLGRELALTTQGAFKDSQGNFQADEFKSRLKSLSKSIEPWKGIFGKDIPELLNQLEALSGMSIGSASMDVGAMGHRMIGIMGATGARIQNIAAYRDVLASNLIDPTMSNRSVLGAMALAGDTALGLANLSLNTMTSQELQGSVAKFYAGTARSKYADRFALAYSKWMESNQSGTADKFRQALRDSMAGGMTHQEALLAVSGASNLQELDIYRGTDAYLKAVQDGSGFSMTRELFIGNAAKDFTSRFTGMNYASIAGLSGDQINSLTGVIGSDANSIAQFLSLSQSEKIKRIQGIGVDGATAARIANDVSVQAMMSTGSSNVEEARSLFSAYINEAEQAEQAKTLASFSSAVSALRSPGGIRGVIEEIKKSGGKADVSKLIKGYTGGVSVIDAFLKTLVKGGAPDITGHEAVVQAGLNFALNNYTEIGEKGRFEDIGKLLTSDNADDMLKGYRIAAGLDALGQDTISKMTDAELATVRGRLETAGSDADMGAIARDAFIDSRLEAVTNVNGISLEAVAAAKKVAAGTVTSRAGFVEAFIEAHGGDKNKAREMADKVWGSTKIGDIDGVDPIHKIASTLEKFPEFMDAVINFINSWTSGGK